MNRLLGMCCVGLFAAPFVSAQMDDFLDVFIVKVRPEKQADFNVMGRRIAEANRKAKGDSWIATEVVYGDGNTISFISTRKDYSAIETAMSAFMSAVQEAYGPGGTKKMEADFGNTVAGSHSEVRRRRWDLSINTPKDVAAYSKLVGQARWLRTTRMEVRQGHQADFEQAVKQMKAAYEDNSPSWPIFVSQVVAGGPGMIYYFTTVQPSLAAFDSAPDPRKMMSEEAFLKWQKDSSETIASSDVSLLRITPELSNAPEAIAAASPEFWKPKPLVAAKPKAAEVAKTAH